MTGRKCTSVEAIPNDYLAGLLDFIYELPQGYDSFPEHVLMLINKHFGYHRLTFVPFNLSITSICTMVPKLWISEYRTIGFSRELLERYNLYGYRLDTLRYQNMPQHLWNKPCLTAEETISSGSFLHSEYGQFFVRENLPYHVVLILKNKRTILGLVTIFHTLQEGPFTEQEIDLLSYVSRFASQHYMLAISRSRGDLTRQQFKSYYGNLKCGVIMANHDFQIVEVNSAAETYAADICQAMPSKMRISVQGLPSSQHENVQMLIRAYKGQLFFSSSPFVVSSKQYSYEFQISSFPSHTSNLSRVEMVYLIFLIQSALSESPPEYSEKTRSKLTEREWQVANLITRGLTNEQIAEATSISIHTVKTHILKIYKKLGVKNRVSLNRVLDNMRED